MPSGSNDDPKISIHVELTPELIDSNKNKSLVRWFVVKYIGLLNEMRSKAFWTEIPQTISARSTTSLTALWHTWQLGCIGWFYSVECCPSWNTPTSKMLNMVSEKILELQHVRLRILVVWMLFDIVCPSLSVCLSSVSASNALSQRALTIYLCAFCRYVWVYTKCFGFADTYYFFFSPTMQSHLETRG